MLIWTLNEITMKRFIMTGLALCGAMFGFGQTQLPNNSFEEWETGTYETETYDVVSGWDDVAICAGMQNQYNCVNTVSPHPDSRTGNYAVKVIEGGFWGLSIFDYDFSDKPEAIKFYAKTNNLYSGDTLSLSILFHSGSMWDNNIEIFDSLYDDVVGGANSEYQEFLYNFNIPENSNHNKLSLITHISGDTENDTSFVLIDDIEFIYANDVTPNNSVVSEVTEEVVISSNLIDDIVTLSRLCKSYSIKDTQGQVVLSGKGNVANVARLNSGVYYVIIEKKDGSFSIEPIIKK